mmetsp:Transcript_49044/g.142808  ORF Transcript_49044/g.142808 Transcript_49044/m.142808 type:complete len:252 (-) Transcript_49044:553-1308(-)
MASHTPCTSCWKLTSKAARPTPAQISWRCEGRRSRLLSTSPAMFFCSAIAFNSSSFSLSSRKGTRSCSRNTGSLKAMYWASLSFVNSRRWTCRLTYSRLRFAQTSAEAVSMRARARLSASAGADVMSLVGSDKTAVRQDRSGNASFSTCSTAAASLEGPASATRCASCLFTQRRSSPKMESMPQRTPDKVHSGLMRIVTRIPDTAKAAVSLAPPASTAARTASNMSQNWRTRSRKSWLTGTLPMSVQIPMR